MGWTVTNDLRLGELASEVDSISTEALKDAADHVGSVAQGNAPLLVDVERANRHERPGTLRESMKVIEEGDRVGVAFTDFIAVRQHEDMEYHHDVGEAKFLERAIFSERDEVMRILASRIQEAL